jgi:type IV secretory pathway VirB2 component (pilin)
MIRGRGLVVCVTDLVVFAGWHACERGWSCDAMPGVLSELHSMLEYVQGGVNGWLMVFVVIVVGLAVLRVVACVVIDDDNWW